MSRPPSYSSPMDNTRFNVRSILAGEAPKDAPVTVRGWVRTRRDSKAGISFVHLSDGSAFHPVQVVAPNTLPNYADEVLRITSGCAVEATGTDRAVACQGAAVRDAGERDQGDRLGRRPGYLPDPAEAAHPGVPARGRASAPAHQRDRRSDAGAPHARAGDPSLLRRERLLLGQHADHHRRPTPRGRARCFGCRRSTSPTCRARRRARSISPRISSAARRS